MSGGLKPGGATSGLPAGGTSADVLTGAGTWKAGSDVLHDGLAAFTGSVAGRAIVGDGAGDVQPTSAAVSAALAAADAPALAAQVDAGRVFTPSLASAGAGGWSPVDVTSPGTVTVTGGEIVVSIPNGSNTTLAGGKESRAWPASGTNFEVIARYESTGDADVAIEGVLRINYAVGYLYWILQGTGAWQAYSGFDGVENVELLNGLTGMPRDGTGWTRTRINGQRVTLWTGIGVGSAPPADGAWTLRYDGDRSTLIGKGAPTALALGGRSLGTHTVSGPTAIKWSQVSVRNLGSGG